MIRTYTTLVTFGSNICYHIFIYFPHRRQQNEMKPESYRIHPLSITHHLSSSSNLVQYITVLQLLSITCQHFPTALQAPDLPPQCWQPFRASRPQDRGRLERFFYMAMTSAMTSRGANIKIVNIQDGLLPLV